MKIFNIHLTLFLTFTLVVIENNWANELNIAYFYYQSGTDSIADESPNDTNLIISDNSIDTLVSEQNDTISGSGEDGSVLVDEKGDTTYIRLKNKTISIIDKKDETTLKIDRLENDTTSKEQEEENEETFCEDDKPCWKNFKGHWAGFAFGLNNYVNSDRSFSLSGDDEFMELNTIKSWNFNLNFAQYSLGLGTDHAGIVTGLGIEWCNYHFSDSNIIGMQDNQIVSRAVPENTTRKKFQTTYFTVPLLIELQGSGKCKEDRPYLSAGVIAGIKLASNTKIKYTEDGSKRKEKYRDDYYLSPVRFTLTARAGYKSLDLYCNYSLTPLFLEDHGPELYPVAAGMVITF